MFLIHNHFIILRTVLQILTGVYKSGVESLKESWSENDSWNIFNVTVCLQYFEIIPQFIGFDYKKIEYIVDALIN